MKGFPLTVLYHEGDLPAGVDFGASVAIDSETMGLRFRRDGLCVVQLSAGDGTAHVVRFDRNPTIAVDLAFGDASICCHPRHLGGRARAPCEPGGYVVCPTALRHQQRR